MKKTILSLGILLATAFAGNAEQCDLHIQVVTPDTEMCAGDASVGNLLASRLTRALTADGVTADGSYGQLYISGRFDDIYKETLPGPPVQTVVHTSLTLMVADIFGNKVFDSETFDLRGVGTSPQRAYINALSQLNSRNKALERFIDRARGKVISYFDANYRSLLAKARTAAAQHDFDQALYLTSLIPQCSAGYPEAERAMLKYYQQYIDNEGQILLNKARAEFAMMPNAEGASRAYAYLNRIDTESSAYGAAQSFAREIEKQTKAEYNFQVHQKYNDANTLRLKQIDAARQIGVAFGSGQAASTTNILWK